MLPKLPKKIKNNEALFGLKFRKWIEKNPMLTGSFELKDARERGYFPFSELGELQVAHALRNKSDKGNLIRITVGTIGSPDYVYFRNSYSWIVINYKHGFEIIDIETLLLEVKKGKKSLTAQRAKELSTVSGK